MWILYIQPRSKTIWPDFTSYFERIGNDHHFCRMCGHRLDRKFSRLVELTGFIGNVWMIRKIPEKDPFILQVAWITVHHRDDLEAVNSLSSTNSNRYACVVNNQETFTQSSRAARWQLVVTNSNMATRVSYESFDRSLKSTSPLARLWLFLNASKVQKSI